MEEETAYVATVNVKMNFWVNFANVTEMLVPRAELGVPVVPGRNWNVLEMEFANVIFSAKLLANAEVTTLVKIAVVRLEM